MPERNPLKPLNGAVLSLLRGLIRLYRLFLSPWVGQQCRFHPTCSVYAEEALSRHGPGRGLLLTIARLLSCQPWSKRAGIDPVPDRFEWRALMGYKRAAPDKAE